MGSSRRPPRHFFPFFVFLPISDFSLLFYEEDSAEKRGVRVYVISAKYSQLCAHVVHLVISCFCFAEDGKKMYQSV